MKNNMSNIIKLSDFEARSAATMGDLKGNGVVEKASRSIAAKRAVKVLRKRSRHNSVVLGILEYDWPVATSIIETISDYIGSGIHTNNEPVIYDILEFAIERYSKFLFHTRSTKYEDAIRIAAFIEGLITKTCDVAQMKITNESGTSSWAAGDKASFSEWYKRNGTSKLTVQPEPVENVQDLRKFLYELIANDQVKHILKSANYEKAVVFGSLAASH